jgi:hypothetical protein
MKSVIGVYLRREVFKKEAKTDSSTVSVTGMSKSRIHTKKRKLLLGLRVAIVLFLTVATSIAVMH